MQASRGLPRTGAFTLLAFSTALAAFVACSGSDQADPDDAGRPDAPYLDAGGRGEDGGAIDDADAEPDDDPVDTTPPPGSVGDLAGQAKSHTVIELVWTAPGDDADAAPAGMVAGYDLRWSKQPITTLAEFLAATAATAGAPLAAGEQQKTTITGLEPATTYHFAIRARNGGASFGALSNEAVVTTKSRAKLLITEVAVANTKDEGYDFVELLAAEGGWAEGLVVKQLSKVLYTLGPIELGQNERVVVHATGTTFPDGFAQEDVTQDKGSSTAAFASDEAYDVYSTENGLTGTDNLLTVNDGAAMVDAVAIANRDGTVAAATVTAWAGAKAANAWSFAATPAKGNECASERDAVNVAQPAQDLACGGFATGHAKGRSVNRVGTTDTNTKADFYVAAQSPGTSNAPPPVPTVTTVIAASPTQVDVTFDQEIASASVNAAAFSIAGLSVTAASLSDLNRVTLTTSTQAAAGGYDIDIANTVTTTYGAAIAPTHARFCAYSPTPAGILLTEVNPNIAGGADLVELKVTSPGSLSGYQLRANPTGSSIGTPLATLPAICAAENDLVVVHLKPPAGTAPSSETLTKNEHPSATYAANYDTAWDVLGSTTSDIGFTSQVLAVRSPSGENIEAVVFSNMAAATSGTYISSLQFVQAAGLWLPADCNGAPCTDSSTPSAAQVAADWRGVATAPSGASIRRLAADAKRNSWAVGASSFGLPNP